MKWILSVLALLLIALAIVAIAPRFAGTEAVDFATVKPMLAAAPPRVRNVAVIPRYAAFSAAVAGHPVAGPLWETVVPDQAAYLSWIVGNATIVFWTDGDARGLATDAGPLRVFLMKMILSGRGASVDEVNGRTVFTIGSTAAGGFTIDAPDPGKGHAFFCVPTGGSNAFPPMEPPSITSIRLDDDAVLVDSVAPRSADDPPQFAPALPLPSNAMLAVNVGRAPRMLRDLDRVLPEDLSAAMAGGGQVVLYAIEPKTLFPSPRGVIAVRRAPGDAASITQLLPGVAIEEALVSDRRVISFDRESLDAYRGAAFETPQVPPDAVWFAEIRPRQFVPALRVVEDHKGMKLLSRKAHRAVRNALRWLGPLETAERLTAVRRTTAGEERLRIEIR